MYALKHMPTSEEIGQFSQLVNTFPVQISELRKIARGHRLSGRMDYLLKQFSGHDSFKDQQDLVTELETYCLLDRSLQEARPEKLRSLQD